MRTHLPVSLTAAALASLLLVGGAPGRAQTVITGVHTGADGADITGTGFAGDLSGGDGAAGVSLITPPSSSASGSAIFQNAILTGGKAGKAIALPGTYNARGGVGGDGFQFLSFNGKVKTRVVINGGAFTGGDGGMGTGTIRNALQGGPGGSGIAWAAALGKTATKTVTINGGTFQGGRGGDSNGSGENSSNGGRGGDAFLFSGGLAKINGGTFIGGAGGNASGTPSQTPTAGPGGNALEIDEGTVDISGGSFSSGSPGTATLSRPTPPDIFLNGGHLVLYGSGFTFGGVSNYFGALPAGYGSFSGKLAHNSDVTTISYFQYGINNHTSINLAPIPEFSTVASFGALLLLGLGGFALKSRRGKGSAAGHS